RVSARRELFGGPRAGRPEAGTLRVHYRVAGEKDATGLPPRPLQRWFRRVAPVLAAAARKVYTNDDTPLLDKLPGVTRLLTRQINVLDLLGVIGLGLATGVSAVGLSVWDRLRELVSGRRVTKPLRGLYRRYVAEARKAGDLTPAVPSAAQNWETRLSRLPYQTVKASHIHVLWPKNLADKNAVVEQGLWHVCPAHVYEARVSPAG